MPTYRDEAVVLRTHKLGEADRIVTMLSRITARFARWPKACGARRASSALDSSPSWSPTCSCYAGRSLDIVQQAESLGSYGAEISSDYGRYTAANVMVETADRSRVTTAAGIQQYLLLVGALRPSRGGEHSPGLTLDPTCCGPWRSRAGRRLFGDCAVTGAPGRTRCARAAAGGVVRRRCCPARRPALSRRETLALLAALPTGDWALAEASEPPPSARPTASSPPTRLSP